MNTIENKPSWVKKGIYSCARDDVTILHFNRDGFVISFLFTLMAQSQASGIAAHPDSYQGFYSGLLFWSIDMK